MPSPLLILDLSSALYVGLWDGARVAASRIRPQGTRGETAHGLVDECLEEAGMGPGDLAALAVGIGPGSFTGIRVCGALAQGLAFARRLPLHPFSSLAAVACCLPPGIAGVSAIAANAGKWYMRGPGGAEALVPGEALLAQGGPGSYLAVSGEIPDPGRLRAAFGTVLAAEESLDLGRLAALALAAPPAPEGALRPNYLAASAAEDKLKAGLLGTPGGSRETSP